jgi:hypothetical protein
MRIPFRLALPALLAPAALLAQAPAATFSQTFKAGAPEVEKLMGAFQFREALAKAAALLPAEKAPYDAKTANAVHTSCWAYLEQAQAYALAFRAADGAGQWEKGLEYLNKALELTKENQEKGKEQLTLQMNYWQERAGQARKLMDLNAEPIRELKAKARLEDYETENMERVKIWEKEQAEGEKWAKFFKYDLDMSDRAVDYYGKLIATVQLAIKTQQDEIDHYKPAPGDRKKWTEAVASSRTYLDSLPEKADRIHLAHRLTVLDPDNKKAERLLDVVLGKAAPEGKAAPKGRKR